MTAAERKSDCKLTRDTPYIAPTGELLGVYCEELERKVTSLWRYRTVLQTRRDAFSGHYLFIEVEDLSQSHWHIDIIDFY